MTRKTERDLRREIDDLREEMGAEAVDHDQKEEPVDVRTDADAMVEAMREARDPDYEPDPGEPGDPIPEATADLLREIRRHHASDGAAGAGADADPGGGGDLA